MTPNSRAEALPCPSCSNAEPFEAAGAPFPWVQCSNCRMRGPQALNENEATKAWNNMPRRPAPPSAEPCDECHGEMVVPSGSDGMDSCPSCCPPAPHLDRPGEGEEALKKDECVGHYINLGSAKPGWELFWCDTHRSPLEACLLRAQLAAMGAERDEAKADRDRIQQMVFNSAREMRDLENLRLTNIGDLQNERNDALRLSRFDRMQVGELRIQLDDARAQLAAALAKVGEKDEALEYLIEQAREAEQFCGKICGHRPTDTIKEVESEALALGHGLMVALNPYRSRPAAQVEPKEGIPNDT